MLFSSLAIQASASLLLVPTVLGQYSLQDDYTPSTFGSMFDFFTDDDPTNGYVNYVSQSQAESDGLFTTKNSSIYIGVDSTNVASGRGRNSVRITSKNVYTHGLFILDLEHMPGGQCGTWPAFWTLGPDWPTEGEIDIIENVNSATVNTMSAHTNASCTIEKTTNFSGSVLYTDCDSSSTSGSSSNTGCSIRDSDTDTFGAGFNAVNGGVYATSWTSEAISIWFFPRASIPSDISNSNPDPSGWGTPLAQFTGSGCDIDDHFTNHQIVFDISMCGDWAGNVWSSDSTCSALASTCEDYVQNNPSAFTDTYWLINSLKVYKAYSQTTSTSTVPTTTSTASSTAWWTSGVWWTSTVSSAAAATTTTTTIAATTTTAAAVSSSSAAAAVTETTTVAVSSEVDTTVVVTTTTTTNPTATSTSSSAWWTTSSWWVTIATTLETSTTVAPSATSTEEPTSTTAVATSASTTGFWSNWQGWSGSSSSGSSSGWGGFSGSGWSQSSGGKWSGNSRRAFVAAATEEGEE